MLTHITVELTDKCNLSCKYCYNIWKIPGAERQTFNSYKKAIKVLKQIFKQAPIEQVTLTGGEPFMAERLLEIVLFCRMEGKSVAIISNGSLGTPADYKQLINMGVRLFEMPIHSADPAIHDSITQMKGSWQKSVHSLLEIKRLGGYPVAVIVLTKFNVAELNETLDYIHSIGIQRIMLNRYNIGGNGTADPASVSATHEQLIAAYHVANQKSETLSLTISSNVCTPQCLLKPSDYPRLMFGNCSDNPLRKPITVDVNGDIRLCNHSPVKAGNIFEQELSEILYSPYSLSWKEIVPAYCAVCDLWEKCKGGCRAASEQCGLGLSQVDPILTTKIN
ncbi:MAG: radical SAM protein [Dysgonamonadaceae bacterium]|jgi:radical SAM protein with 4Fe4S-binding SPASM domain|nr:radical SAM protein [Dysgonamonadaceae bacterium]